ncbi:MAG: hypothetical protein KDA84_04655 [Planctomycetaceae bacterium]|nr:hypothetical protein [Planctomycetaceae bacterium]
MSFGEWVVEAFDAVTPNLDGLYRSTNTQSLGGWRVQQQGLVTGSGAASVAIPGLHLIGIAADVAFLMNRMSVCSYGIGAILGNENGCGNILEAADFAVILARWAGDASINDAAIGKASAELAGKVGSKSAAKLLAKTMCEKGGLLAGQKLAGKLGAKVGAKFGAKLGSKATLGFIPFLGAAVGGGINLWFITSVADAAEEWYRTKVSTANQW